MIAGVRVKALRVIPDERGRLMEILRSDDKLFQRFSQLYMTTAHPVQIPALVLHGFKGVGTDEAIVINCPTELYHYQEPDEFRVDPFSGEVPYDWALKMK